jgi:hypothetical protein
VKRLFSVLIFAKRFIDRFCVGGGDEQRHNRASYGVSPNSATLAGESAKLPDHGGAEKRSTSCA